MVVLATVSAAVPTAAWGAASGASPWLALHPTHPQSHPTPTPHPLTPHPQVLCAPEVPQDEAAAGERIAEVWRVVAGVADGVRLLHGRFSPGSNSLEWQRQVGVFVCVCGGGGGGPRGRAQPPAPPPHVPTPTHLPTLHCPPLTPGGRRCGWRAWPAGSRRRRRSRWRRGGRTWAACVASEGGEAGGGGGRAGQAGRGCRGGRVGALGGLRRKCGCRCRVVGGAPRWRWRWWC